MTSKHVVIIIPGLGDETKILRWAVGFWRWYGLDPVVYSVGWRDGSIHFGKLKRLVARLMKYK